MERAKRKRPKFSKKLFLFFFRSKLETQECAGLCFSPPSFLFRTQSEIKISKKVFSLAFGRVCARLLHHVGDNVERGKKETKKGRRRRSFFSRPPLSEHHRYGGGVPKSRFVFVFVFLVAVSDDRENILSTPPSPTAERRRKRRKRD